MRPYMQGVALLTVQYPHRQTLVMPSVTDSERQGLPLGRLTGRAILTHLERSPMELLFANEITLRKLSGQIR